MNNIYVFSGPCGCGKSTLADAYASYLVHQCGKLQVYVIHGDDFHRGFVETQRHVGSDCPQFLYWADILKFNWECILSAAQKALDRKLDVVIDYVVEDELPLLEALAGQYDARLFYVVLTASEEVLKQRLIRRGSEELIDRSLFLKSKLENAAENQGHLYDISSRTIDQEIEELDIAQYEVSIR